MRKGFGGLTFFDLLSGVPLPKHLGELPIQRPHRRGHRHSSPPHAHIGGESSRQTMEDSRRIKGRGENTEPTASSAARAKRTDERFHFGGLQRVVVEPRCCPAVAFDVTVERWLAYSSRVEDGSSGPHPCLRARPNEPPRCLSLSLSLLRLRGSPALALPPPSFPPLSLFSSPSLRFPKREAVFTFVVGGDHINRRPPVAVLRRLYPICCRFFLRPLPFCISRQSFPRRCLPEPLVDPSWDRAMIKFIKIKDQKREDAANSSGRAPVKKQSAGELRLHKDISELNLPKSTVISFPNGKDDLMNFEISIRPDEGYYQGGTFVFTFQVSPSYPHEPPKVKCKTKVYHPNIDLEGNVCLNILREDWKPVLNINTVVYGLILLFMDKMEMASARRVSQQLAKRSPCLGQRDVSVSVNPGADRRLSRSRDRVAAFLPVVLSVGLPPVPPPLVGDFAQLPGSWLSDGWRRAFQRFAVRTSKAIEDVSTKAAQARERLVAQLKDATKDDDSFRRP
ncbi:hypothetical protein MUK42_03696 [Musa troglodytarum]|uniref:UBC core domain-containing protein n=3 Tax=Musa troglodytarum TaxID=320322 RepID=A0A9E7KWM4_9LILI|nr:hypothetical protein MUK42_03696 [Musa troglodytarum]URE36990.1 hypothetical protein MUK42_03696 [Musa troglodytarum]